MRQIYSDYTEEDFKVWKILFERQMQTLSDKACQTHLEGMRVLDFRSDKIPDFDKVNAILRERTGWALEVVPGIIPSKEFFEMLADKKFPATTWLRKMSELDYLEEPDMFHDVFGHVPLLTQPEFCDFLKGMSDIAMCDIENERTIEKVSRTYWWTVEFGLIRENDALKIYGAGLISSIGEAKHALSETPEKYAFDVATLLESGYNIDTFQPKYFVIESFKQLYHSLSALKEQIFGAPYEAKIES